MSKKLISLFLSAAMLAAIFCVGFGALSASADDNVTYYFLAPDNYFKTEAGASNTNVGYYFWEAGGNGDWPGQAATPAPEVHPNAFKISVPNNDNVATIIFNAFVDAGSPADPELAKVAHQTANINVEDENYDGWIYVLAQDEAHQSTNDLSGAVTSSGDWFKLDEFKTSYNYGTYGFADAATDTKDTPNPSKPSTKKYAAGDIVTVTYNVKDLDGLGAANSIISYNKDVLAVDDSAFEFRGNKIWYEAGNVDVKLELNNTDEGILIGFNTYEPEFGTKIKEESTIVTIQFKALKDFNEDDVNIKLTTTKLVKLTTVKSIDITDDADKYLFLNINPPEDSDTETDSENISDTDKDTDSDSKTNTDKDTDSDSKTNTDKDTDSDGKTNTDKDTDSDSKTNTDKDTDSDNKPTTPKPTQTLYYGNIDGDEKVTSADALKVLRASVKLETLTKEQEYFADVNGDSKVDSADSLAVLRYSVGFRDKGVTIGFNG